MWVWGNNDSQQLSHVQQAPSPYERPGEDYRMPVNTHLKQWPLRDHQNHNGLLTIVFCFLNWALTLRFVSWQKNSMRWHQKYYFTSSCNYCPRRKWALLMSQTVIFLVFIQGDSEKWGTRNFLRNVFPLERLLLWLPWIWSSGNHNYKYLFITWCFVVAT